jgi:hypothetical protein
VDNALHVYVKESRRGGKIIPRILQPLDAKLQESDIFERIAVNDFMTNMSIAQRYSYLLNMQQGMETPIFSFNLFSRGGSGAGVNPRVIWRLPPQDKKGGT